MYFAELNSLAYRFLRAHIDFRGIDGRTPKRRVLTLTSTDTATCPANNTASHDHVGGISASSSPINRLAWRSLNLHSWLPLLDKPKSGPLANLAYIPVGVDADLSCLADKCSAFLNGLLPLG